MTDYNFVYSYTREWCEYSDLDQNLYYSWNINNPDRIDGESNKIKLVNEIKTALPDKMFICFAGYDYDPTIVSVQFQEELIENEINTLNTVVYDHKNNIIE